MDLQNIVENQYFNWLYDYVCKNRSHNNLSYRKLLMTLHEIEFIFGIPNDINRAVDGVDLRYRFSLYIEETEGIYIPHNITGPCSVLEMMVALAIRCEETIMDDTSYGDRTGQWFWRMISNLGIGLMSDDIYDRDFVKRKIDIFLRREYESNGKGGLFFIRDCEDDLTTVEIWAQLCWYLDKFV